MTVPQEILNTLPTTTKYWKGQAGADHFSDIRNCAPGSLFAELQFLQKRHSPHSGVPLPHFSSIAG